MRLGVVLFGLGRAGAVHFNGIVRNRRIDLLYVVEMEEEIARSVKALETEGITMAKAVDHSRTDEVLNDNAVHFVVVATPTHTHEKIVRAALQAGKGVFCEKPIAKSLESVAEIYDEATRVAKPLFCAFQRRFDPNFDDVRERVRNGEVGRVHVIKTCSRDSPLPSIEYLRHSGGMFVDCAVHDVDLVCWILGETPTSVQAQAHAFKQDIADLGDVDTVAIVMKFPSGALAQIDLSRHSCYGYDQRLEVHGDKGMLIASNAKDNTVSHYSPLSERSGSFQHSFPQRYRQAYDNELNHFVDVMLGKKQLMLSKKDAIVAVRLANTCEDSYKAGKTIQFRADE
ncbi:myo-inositol 2-dehydrogenase-like [Oscarella lobularis]|uniref:myo-inositol 2-dehydrogenase-like n=1 Tax=Oscarella lobularis TaxID=121494 RepID=UPI003313B2BC